MRKILFRAKDLLGNWVEGDLHLRSKMPHIHSDVFTTHYIDKETVSQFTGLYDKNRAKVFFNDIVRFMITITKEAYHTTMRKTYIGVISLNKFMQPCIMVGNEEFHIENLSKAEIIGNIFDNKELIK